MNRTLLTFLSVILPTFCLPFAQANSNTPETLHSDRTVIIPVGSQSKQLRQSLSLPEHGQTMDEVRKMLGNANKTETIGTPPITRWHYPEKKITIYFENNKVLRSVLSNISDTAQ